MTKDLTVQQTFEHAYAFFNEQLFGGELPECMVVLHRKRGARGYFWQDQWTARKPDGTDGRGRITALCNRVLP